MSMKPYYYLMAGAAIPIDKFPGNPWDDKWLPYSEGHEGVEMSIVSGEGSEYYYCGKVLAKADPYEDFQYKAVKMKPEEWLEIFRWLKHELNWSEPASLLLACCWY